MVLAPLETHERVEGQGLRELAARAMLLVEEKTVSSKARGLARDRLGRHAMLPRDLSERAAANEPMQDGNLQVGSLEPIRRREGLVAEPSTAGVAAITLDPVRGDAASVEADLDETP
jgi:hypothetical protein